MPGLARVSEILCLSSKAAFELLPFTRQHSLPSRPENEVGDNFSKVGNEALLKVMTFKRWQQGREGNRKTGHDTAELGIASIGSVLVSLFFSPPPKPLISTSLLRFLTQQLEDVIFTSCVESQNMELKRLRSGLQGLLSLPSTSKWIYKVIILTTSIPHRLGLRKYCQSSPLLAEPVLP